jgi:bifunctional N-acetylglucosamine-1-phosphate-uridyltransferase/glucosamine-1-phosphate-acetyltransferase GlmU-like protein
MVKENTDEKFLQEENTDEKFLQEYNPKYDLIKEEDIKLFVTNLPVAPTKETIKRLLIQLPQQITSLETQTLEVKKEIGDGKVVLKAKKNLLDIEKSEVRKKEIDKFQKENASYMLRTQDLMREIMNSQEQNASLKKAYLQEVSRVLKPERPTKADLDDLANIETKHLQKEIDDLEEKINSCQFELEVLSTKRDFYNNMWVTFRKYSDIVVNEMRMLGEH